MTAQLRHHPLADLATLTGTTVVYRELDGEPEMVVVCGECSDIHTVNLQEAMSAALNDYMGWHRKDRHHDRALDTEVTE